MAEAKITELSFNPFCINEKGKIDNLKLNKTETMPCKKVRIRHKSTLTELITINSQ